MTTLKEILEKATGEVSDSELITQQKECDDRKKNNKCLERPDAEYVLKSISLEQEESTKSQKDPTSDLIEVSVGLSQMELQDRYPKALQSGYLVWCENTKQMWHAPTKLCLDKNFIYRKDLTIFEVHDAFEAAEFYSMAASAFDPEVVTRKSCYILNNPAAETYEVYYESSYPTEVYGKATPNGMNITKYENRFHRDMAIMQLDKMYSTNSAKRIGKLLNKPMESDEAIIISDGCLIRNVCACSCYYIDDSTLSKFTQALTPSSKEQGVLIAEIKGATNALLLCKLNGKKRITYYYDNTSILNIFRNKRMEYVSEISAYKKLLEEMHREGSSITFIELHPKNQPEGTEINKALAFFHNNCDKECRDMANIYVRDYKDIALSNEGQGKTYRDTRRQFKPKNQTRHNNNK